MPLAKPGSAKACAGIKAQTTAARMNTLDIMISPDLIFLEIVLAVLASLQDIFGQEDCFMRSIHLLPLLALLAAPATTSAAEDKTPPVALVLKDHKFEPKVIEVPAGQRIRIELTNRDGSSDEFDSEDLKV